MDLRFRFKLGSDFTKFGPNITHSRRHLFLSVLHFNSHSWFISCLLYIYHVLRSFWCQETGPSLTDWIQETLLLYLRTEPEWGLRNFVSDKVRMSDNVSRSQWPHGLKHELSSTARTLGSWVRILLEALMFVCVYCAFFCPVCRALRRADPPSKESYRLFKS
jgi:hypothetical protein